MKVPIKLINKRTNAEFDNPNKHLILYATNNPDFEFVYGEVKASEPEVESYSLEALKAMSMKDLQTIVDGLEIECDKRRKDSMIDGILNHGR